MMKPISRIPTAAPEMIGMLGLKLACSDSKKKYNVQ